MAIALALIYQGMAGTVSCIINILSSIILFFFLFRFKMMGAGDIKLLSVISGFLGISNAIQVFCVAIFIGSIISFVKCIRYGYLIDRLSYFRQYISELFREKRVKPYYIRERDGDAVVIPFSVAISIGCLVVYSGILEYVRL